MTRQLHRRLNAAQRDTARMARAATVKYALPRPAGTPNLLSRKENEHMPVDNPLVPLVLLAAEIGEDVTQLARRLDGAVIVDNIGMRVIPRDVAGAVLAEHHAEQAKTRQRDDARRERLAEVSRRARSTIRGGVPALHGDPLADLLAVDGDPPRIQEAEARLDAWLAGRSTGARISPPTKAAT